MAKIIREDFLQQDAFSTFDYMCPIYKTVGMMRAIVTFYDQCHKAILESSGENKITMNLILNQLKALMIRITKLKAENPKQTKVEIGEIVKNLCNEITAAVKSLTDK